MDAIATHNQSSCQQTIGQFLERGLEISDFLNGLLKFQRNLLYARIKGIQAVDIGLSDEGFAKLEPLSSQFGHGDLLRLAKMTSDLIFQVKSAPQPRITLEMGIARMAYLDRTETLRELMKKLDQADTVKKNS